MQTNEPASSICFALWQLYFANTSRFKVSEDDLLKRSGCSYDEFIACLKSDDDLQEIMMKTGYSACLHDQTIFSHAA